MTKDNFNIFILALVFITQCFIVFLVYMVMRVNMDALAKPNEYVVNNYYTPEQANMKGVKVK